MTDSVKKYIDDCIKHDVLFEMFGNQLYDLNKADYEDLKAQLLLLLDWTDTLTTKTSVNTALSDIKNSVSEYAKALKTRLDYFAKDISEKESSFLKDLFKEVFNISLFVPSKITKLIPLVSYSNQNSINSFVDNFTQKVSDTYKNAVTTAYVMGTTKEDVKATLEQTTAVLDRTLETESKNIATGIQRQTRNYVFLKNDKKLTFVWNSILDTSTCLICGELNGKQFKNISEVPGLPPLHLNCRCSIVAVPEGTQIELPSYSQWLEEQSEDSQKEILGTARYKLYKNGTKIENFVNNGKKLTLNEIYKKNI